MKSKLEKSLKIFWKFKFEFAVIEKLFKEVFQGFRDENFLNNFFKIMILNLHKMASKGIKNGDLKTKLIWFLKVSGKMQGFCSKTNGNGRSFDYGLVILEALNEAPSGNNFVAIREIVRFATESYNMNSKQEKRNLMRSLYMMIEGDVVRIAG